MPKPKLPEGKRKDIVLLIRLTPLEKAVIITKAQRRKCKTLSEYIRKLVKEDKGRDLDVVV